MQRSSLISSQTSNVVWWRVVSLVLISYCSRWICPGHKFWKNDACRRRSSVVWYFADNNHLVEYCCDGNGSVLVNGVVSMVKLSPTLLRHDLMIKRAKPKASTEVHHYLHTILSSYGTALSAISHLPISLLHPFKCSQDWLDLIKIINTSAIRVLMFQWFLCFVWARMNAFCDYSKG